MKKNFCYRICLYVLLINACVIYSFSDVIRSQDIVEIYEKFVKPNYNDEYKYRYVPLPTHKSKAPWRWEGKDFPRVIALLEFERFVNEHKLSSKKALALNGHDPEWHYLKTEKIVHIKYEENQINHDLHSFNLREDNFDFVMVNQTLEHVYDPVLCLKNINKHMCKGGILYLNVPVNSIPHETPFHHYTGITPVGLGAIAKAAGFEIISIGQWGNLEYLTKMHSSKSWLDYRKLKNPGLNDLDSPVITWIFAIKI